MNAIPFPEVEFASEQIALRDSLQRLLSRHGGPEASAPTGPTGFNRSLWASLAELGVLALPFAEDAGGLGGTSLDAMLVAEAMGEALVIEPWIGTAVLAGSVLQSLATPSQREAVLPSVMRGELLLAVAHHEPLARFAMAPTTTTARRGAGGWRLSGHKAMVHEAPLAGRLLVSARLAHAGTDQAVIGIFLVPVGTPGLRLVACSTHDGRGAAEIHFDDIELPAEALLGRPESAAAALTHAFDRAHAALVAESAGIMRLMCRLTVEHLRTRRQFGAPLASFQVLRHQAVRMGIACEFTRSMAWVAALHADSTDAPARARVVSAARAYAIRQARFVGQQAIQLHGGMGMASESIVSHAFKRLSMLSTTWGDLDHHLDRATEGFIGRGITSTASIRAHP